MFIAQIISISNQKIKYKTSEHHDGSKRLSFYMPLYRFWSPSLSSSRPANWTELHKRFGGRRSALRLADAGRWAWPEAWLRTNAAGGHLALSASTVAGALSVRANCSRTRSLIFQLFVDCWFCSCRLSDMSLSWRSVWFAC